MAAPITSKLDATQVLPAAFDEATGRLRVDVVASPYHSSDLVISDVDDSIKIGSGNNGPYLKINPDGSITTVAVIGDPPTQETILSYGEANSVAAGTTATVITYTVPSNATTFHLQRVVLSGDNVAIYTLTINGATRGKSRTNYTSFDTSFDLAPPGSKGLMLNSGDVVQTTVTHNSSSVGNFNATLLAIYQT